MINARRLKRGALALSLANLIFLSVWFELLTGSKHPYVVKHAAFYPHYWIVMLNVLGLAGLMLVADYFYHHRGIQRQVNLAAVVFGLTILIPLDFARKQLPFFRGSTLEDKLPAWGYAGLGLVVLLAGLFVVLCWPQRTVRVFKGLVLSFLPFVGVTFGRAAWTLTHYQALVMPPPPSAPEIAHPTGPMPRVVWLLFDELDERVAFTARPESVHLPQLDRFRQQATMATEAFPPAGMTMLSLPALISGRLVKAAAPSSGNELQVTFADSNRAVGWTTQSDVFAEARALGANGAVVGYYHPYDRLFGGHLVTSFWQPFEAELPFHTERPLLACVAEQWLCIGSFLPLMPRLLPNVMDGYRHGLIRSYISLRDAAEQVLVRPDLDLVFVHWPIPHPRGIYNRFTSTYAREGDAHPSSYLDNLALVDRTLGEIRQQMEQAGVWDGSTVIITADHWWRKELWEAHFTPEERVILQHNDHHVPFMVKLPGQRQPATYEHRFNTIVTHDLLLALLRREISEPAQLAAWLDRQQTIGDTPYVGNPDYH